MSTDHVSGPHAAPVLLVILPFFCFSSPPIDSSPVCSLREIYKCAVHATLMAAVDTSTLKTDESAALSTVIWLWTHLSQT
jgi:hypothetical protein